MFSAIGLTGRTESASGAGTGPAVGAESGAGAAGPVIRVEALTKIYEPSGRWMRLLLKSAIDQPVRALEDVSITVNEGEVCAVVGPNGAGKSTLFRILMGLTTPSSGTATVMGLDATTQSRRVRGLVGWMPADSQTLFLRHTSYQNLWFHGRLQGLGGRKLEKRIDETLEMVGLAHARNYSCHAMSTGMRARLLLARALLHRPRVLILDEPTGTVDPIGAHQLLSLIQTLTYELRIAVLLSSHRLEEIDALRDNVMFLDRGHLVHWGHLDSLRNLWELPRLVIQFKDHERATQGAKVAAELPDVEVEAVEGDEVVVAAELDPGALLVHLGPLVADILSVTQAKMPLRDLLAKLVAERR
jgi:ABC-2 type transport system ATP-binding protein